MADSATGGECGEYRWRLVQPPLEQVLADKIYDLLLGYGPHYAVNFGPDMMARMLGKGPGTLGMTCCVATTGSEEQEEIVGHACVIYDPHHPEIGLLGGVITAEPHRRKGISRCVVHQVVQAHDAVGGRWLVLGTGNPNAAGVYRTEGFRDLAGGLDGAFKGYNPDDVGETVMLRDAQAASPVESGGGVSETLTALLQSGCYDLEATDSAFEVQFLGRQHWAGLVLLLTAFPAEESTQKLPSVGISHGLDAEEKLVVLVNAAALGASDVRVVVSRSTGRVHGIAVRKQGATEIYCLPGCAGAVASLEADALRPGITYRASFQQTMLRIKDPSITVPFYEKHFGMKVVHRYDFPQWKFSLYFLERPREGAELPEPGTKASEEYLWNMEGTTLELTHNHGSENDDAFAVWSGNSGKDLSKESPLFMEGPTRGFGHIAFNVEDVYAACADLENDGVRFQKKPDEGRMKGLAFALDPDGYWIEIVQREKDLFPERYNLSQTMMRVKDARRTKRFYGDILGMTLIRAMHIPNDFSNYFFACLTEEQKENAPDPEGPEARNFVKTLWQPVLELTHNHGTETDEKFGVHTGNSDPVGFGHIGFLVDDLAACCAEMSKAGVSFHKRPQDGNMSQIAFALDPDGYRVELIQRGSTFEGACSNF